MNIAFIGLGNMGSGMARNLLKAGQSLVACCRRSGCRPMPLASLVRDRFLAALAQGWGEADWAAIARISFRSAGL